MLIPSVPESHEEAGIGDGFHLREKPFLVERLDGPSTTPASRMNGLLSDFLAFSSSSRTIRPLGRPVLRAVLSSHCARSSGIRTVIVLLICPKCNTDVSRSALLATMVPEALQKRDATLRPRRPSPAWRTRARLAGRSHDAARHGDQ